MKLADSGTFTFLFAALEPEGHELRTHADPAGARSFGSIVGAAVGEHDGTLLVEGNGRATALFVAAADAVDAAIAAQQAAARRDPSLQMVTAVHAGGVEMRRGAYTGRVLERGPSVAAIGLPGQVLVTAPAYRLLPDPDRSERTFIDLGDRRPPDLSAEHHLFLVDHPDLAGADTPARSPDCYPNNLPTQLTRFIDRAEEIATAERLLAEHRLLTITGGAGVGKTRLAIHLAAHAAQQHPDGSWLVELARLTGPERLAEAAATALGAARGVSPLEGPPTQEHVEQSVIGFLRGKRALLILDGCDPVLEPVARFVSTILASCPLTSVLLTSREPISLPGEQQWHLGPLAFPSLAAETSESPAQIAEYPAVRLFVDRAREVRGDFIVDEHSAAPVAQIARRLDGIPLALELAAARVSALDVIGIAAHFDDRLEEPPDGDGEALPHQQPLEAAIDWSYETLDEGERTMLALASVFRSGFTLPAAAGVATAAGIDDHDVVDLLTGLVDKSMLDSEPAPAHEVRFSLSRPLRRYAASKLAARPDLPDLHRPHADYYASFAARAHAELRGGSQAEWLDRVEMDRDNLREAFRWSIDAGDREMALRLLAGMYWFWFVRRNPRGSRWATRALAVPGPAADDVEMRARIGGGLLLAVSGRGDEAKALLDEGTQLAEGLGQRDWSLEGRLYQGLVAQAEGDLTSAGSLFQEALDVAQQEEQLFGIAWAKWFLGGVARRRGDSDAAGVLVEQSLAAFRQFRDPFGTANCLIVLGSLARGRQDYTQAREFYEEALQLFRQTKDPVGTTAALNALAREVGLQGDYGRAVILLDESAAISRRLGNSDRLATALTLLSRAERGAGDFEKADASVQEALLLAPDIGDDLTADALEVAAGISRELGDFGRAARLFGAAEAVGEAAAEDGDHVPEHRYRYDRDVAATRIRLGTERMANLWAEGRAMAVEAAVAYALESETTRAELEAADLSPAGTDGAVATTLGSVGVRREVRVAGLRFKGRRRRPSGEKAPLPRDLRTSGWFWVVAGVSLLALWISIFAWTGTAVWWTDRDMAVVNWFFDHRTDLWNDVMKGVQFLGSVWLIRPVRWAVLFALIFYKRWRHLVAALIVVLAVELIAQGMTIAVGRPRPFVVIIGDWFGYSHPSVPVARLSVTLALIGLVLIPRGKWRNRWFVVGAVLVTMLGVANVYLGVDHPTDGFTAALLGVSFAIVFFRLWVPETVFPVTYSKGRTAHLAIDPRREEAIRAGIEDQIGLEVVAIEPFALEASGGSTPLRLQVSQDPDEYIFGKLYSRTHLRSDRWYKVGRTVLYGTQEDEVRFTSVRRLVEYEHYVQLLMKDAGLPSAEPYGIVEITPEREYLIVTEFLDGATELTDAEIDDALIDDALLVVRRMWDAGIAHRDLKPANVMERNGRIVLIDVAFATIRPSPWRQAVDLANMMMILALGSDPETVYQRALQFFSPEDIAEAFAATRSITIPMQSRSSIQQLKRTEGRDLIHEFRSLAPPRELISVQRWSPRRVMLTVGVGFLGLILVAMVVENISGRGFI